VTPCSVLLVNPPFSTADIEDASFPLGLGYLGACLRVRGHHVSYLDSVGLSLESAISAVKAAIMENSVEVVGVGAVTAAYANARELLLSVKEEFSDVITVLGGCTSP